ncbi:MAG: hypothetical protein RML12_06195 [Xanthomonadales bacterium]|nr:hypothetical protein [Xanthomonadales bacterium]
MVFAPGAALRNGDDERTADVPWVRKFTVSPWNYPYPGNDQHPYLVWNLYRIRDGRLEQIGASGVKHAFYTINWYCAPGACGAGGGQILGRACYDIYSAEQQRPRAGPRAAPRAGPLHRAVGALRLDLRSGLHREPDPSQPERALRPPAAGSRVGARDRRSAVLRGGLVRDPGRRRHLEHDGAPRGGDRLRWLLLELRPRPLRCGSAR